jgi:hypothetical protein
MELVEGVLVEVAGPSDEDDASGAAPAAAGTAPVSLAALRSIGSPAAVFAARALESGCSKLGAAASRAALDGSTTPRTLPFTSPLPTSRSTTSGGGAAAGDAAALLVANAALHEEVVSAHVAMRDAACRMLRAAPLPPPPLRQRTQADLRASVARYQARVAELAGSSSSRATAAAPASAVTGESAYAPGRPSMARGIASAGGGVGGGCTAEAEMSLRRGFAEREEGLRGQIADLTAQLKAATTRCTKMAQEVEAGQVRSPGGGGMCVCILSTRASGCVCVGPRRRRATSWT